MNSGYLGKGRSKSDDETGNSVHDPNEKVTPYKDTQLYDCTSSITVETETKPSVAAVTIEYNPPQSDVIEIPKKHTTPAKELTPKEALLKVSSPPLEFVNNGI